MTEDQYVVVTALTAARAAALALQVATPPVDLSENFDAARRHLARAVMELEARLEQVSA